MNSPAVGFAYALWLRTRWMILGLLATIIVFAAAAQLFPHADEVIVPIALAALVFQLVPVLNVFTYSPADLAAKGSCFPTDMMVLPVATRWLTGWPIIYCSTTFVMVWIVVAGLILIPAGLRPPLVWPAAVMAAGTAWVQALAWSPFPSPYVRAPSLIVAVLPLAGLMFWASLHPASRAISVIVTLGIVMWWMVAYGVAAWGLQLARAGSQGNWLAVWPERRRVGRQVVAGGRIRTSFRSASAAQLWHECRRNVLMLPAMIALLSPLLLVMLIHNVINPGASQGLLIESVLVSPAMVGCVLLVSTPLLISATAGSHLGKFDLWGPEPMSSFFATRPMATAQFIGIKLRAAAISAILTSCVVLAVFATWAAVEASSLNPRDSLVRGVLEQARPREIADAALLAVGWLAILWKTLVSGMVPALTGRKWFAISVGIVSLACVLLLLGVAVLIYRHQWHETLLGYLPWLLGGLVVMKSCAAAAVGIALVRSGLVRPLTLAKLLAGWMAVVIGVFAIACGYLAPTWELAVAVVLLLPLVRIGLAPLALAWNRHR